MSILSFLINTVQHNQIAQAALVAAPATAVTYMARSIPAKAYQGVKRLISVDVRFNSDNPDYEVISRFITANVIKDVFSRNFVYQAETKWNDEMCDSEVKHRTLTVGYGTHIGVFQGKFLLVERYLDEGSNIEKFKEHLVLTFFTRRKQAVKDFADAVAKAAGANLDAFEKVPVYINSGKYWDRMGKLPLRSIDTVFTTDDAGQRVVDAIRSFEGEKEENHRLGLPHHLGIMLTGEPGCGKSSLIHAVASATERSVFYLNLGSVTKDAELTSLLSGNRDWSRIILAIEDVDAAGVEVQRDIVEEDDDEDDGAEEIKTVTKGPAQAAPKRRSPVSLSALLNVLDGILCPDGLVVIATTNHHDRLDPALKRQGRFDQTIELGKLGYADFERMARMFHKDPASFEVANDTMMSGAAMRALILEAA